MSQYATDYVRYAWQVLNGFRTSHEKALAAIRDRDIAPYLDTSRPLWVLDLANGRLRPQYTLFKAAGHHVYGIDLANRPVVSRLNLAYRAARWLYLRKLRASAEDSDHQTLVCGDVGVLPFPDNSFDLVSSVAAFEHFLDVGAVVGELQRVLRPGALAWICVHLFTSPSGGHNLSFAEMPVRTIPDGVDAWDHLRRRRLPFHVPLNEWRRDQYLEVFGRHFELLSHYCALREGEELLDPALEAELSDYSRDELTCWAYVIVARKKSTPAHS
jgi:ubiquinone/menaquinone biosynthesis C-methylase UbiE